MKAQRLSEARQLSLDIITTLPQSIIEIILCLLPIEEAARTSILAREWRYKWTKIPKLVFHHTTVKRLPDERALSLSDWFKLSESEHARFNKEMRCKLFYAINQVLLLSQSPIHEFTLSMYAADHIFSDIDQIILHLSRNHTVKKLTLDLGAANSYSLPLTFFSLHHLMDLCLEYCGLSHTPLFDGFDSLTRLTLNRVMSNKEALLHLLCNCPSLRSMRLFVHLQTLNHEVPSILELFKCLPMIEHLTIWGETILLLAQSSVQEELPVSLIHLKYCSIEQVQFNDDRVWTFLFVLIKCAPNLEKIKLEIGSGCDHGVRWVNPNEYTNILKQYSDVWLECLHEFKIVDFRNLKHELEFVKLILTRSPNLKKVILFTDFYEKYQEMELMRILLRAPRVSYVEIIVENRYKFDDD